MPQPTLYSLPFKVKEVPSADGQTGGVVAGVCAVEGEDGNRLGDTGTLDAGALAMTIGMLLDGVDAGLLDGLPLIADDAGVFDASVLLIKLETLVLVDESWVEEEGKTEAAAELVMEPGVELGADGVLELMDVDGDVELAAEEVGVMLVLPKHCDDRR